MKKLIAVFAAIGRILFVPFRAMVWVEKRLSELGESRPPEGLMNIWLMSIKASSFDKLEVPTGIGVDELIVIGSDGANAPASKLALFDLKGHEIQQGTKIELRGHYAVRRRE